MNFKINNHPDAGWFISQRIPAKWCWNYLWHDGSLHSDACDCTSDLRNTEEGYWKTKQEAETFLRDYEMNVTKVKLEQAQRDKASIEANIVELEKQLNQTNVPEHLYLGMCFNIKQCETQHLGMIIYCPMIRKYTICDLGNSSGGYYLGFEEPTSMNDLQKKLIEHHAYYLGSFGEVYARKEK